MGNNQNNCNCNNNVGGVGGVNRCYECEFSQVGSTRPRRPRLASDCIVVDSLICNQKVFKVAEINLPIATLDPIIEIGPGGTISPLVTLTPDLSGVVSQVTVTKDLIINTGYLPANITILGIPLPLQVHLPFQQETICPGVCPEDTVVESPYQIESIVIQGIEAFGVGVASILFKVVLSTNIIATRPVIAKADDLRVVQDVNENRCSTTDFDD